jgi:hypothetical protein
MTTTTTTTGKALETIQDTVIAMKASTNQQTQFLLESLLTLVTHDAHTKDNHRKEVSLRLFCLHM